MAVLDPLLLAYLSLQVTIILVIDYWSFSVVKKYRYDFPEAQFDIFI